MESTLAPAKSLWFYHLLQKVRPAELASTIKSVLGIRRRNLILADQSTFWIDPVSHLGFQLLSTGKYEPEVCDMIQGLLRPKDTFVDIGANEGFFSVLAGKRVGRLGRVIAIEPQSRLQSVIDANLRLNQLENVRVCPFAIGEKVGTAQLFLASELNSGSSSLHAHSRWKRKTETVRLGPLDQVLSENSVNQVRLIKIDCEGAEREVIRGAKEILNRALADFVSVDFHEGIAGPEAVREIDTQMRNSGYLLSQLGNGVWLYHRPDCEKDLSVFGPSKRIVFLK